MGGLVNKHTHTHTHVQVLVISGQFRITAITQQESCLVHTLVQSPLGRCGHRAALVVLHDPVPVPFKGGSTHWEKCTINPTRKAAQDRTPSTGNHAAQLPGSHGRDLSPEEGYLLTSTPSFSCTEKKPVRNPWRRGPGRHRLSPTIPPVKQPLPNNASIYFTQKQIYSPDILKTQTFRCAWSNSNIGALLQNDAAGI